MVVTNVEVIKKDGVDLLVIALDEDKFGVVDIDIINSDHDEYDKIRSLFNLKRK